MRPEFLISSLVRDDVRLWSNGDRLRYRGPRNALTPEILTLLQSQKNAILALLSDPIWATVATWPADLFESWEEKAAILEHMDNIPCKQAEKIAFALYKESARQRQKEAD